MARPRSHYAELVGEWITAQRSALGLTQSELGARVGASLRTVGNVERGTTAIDVRMRPAWEAALGWAPGTLTAAYTRGVQPLDTARPQSIRASMLATAGIGDDLATDQTVSDVLSSGLSDQDKIALLRVWKAQREVFDRAFSAACEASGISQTDVVNG